MVFRFPLRHSFIPSLPLVRQPALPFDRERLPFHCARLTESKKRAVESKIFCQLGRIGIHVCDPTISLIVSSSNPYKSNPLATLNMSGLGQASASTSVAGSIIDTDPAKRKWVLVYTDSPPDAISLFEFESSVICPKTKSEDGQQAAQLTF